MTPRILTISGGPRRDGCSAEMLRLFTSGFDAAFVHYDAYDCGFAPCTDCRICREYEGCANNDMDSFFADFETADGIIIASPVYNMSFPAPMKVILDRMQRYYSARFFLKKRPPIVRHRPVALLLSAGSPDENGQTAARQLEKIFTVTNCELLCSVVINNTDNLGSISDREHTIRREAAKFAAHTGVITNSSQNF